MAVVYDINIIYTQKCMMQIYAFCTIKVTPLCRLLLAQYFAHAKTMWLLTWSILMSLVTAPLPVAPAGAVDPCSESLLVEPELSSIAASRSKALKQS